MILTRRNKWKSSGGALIPIVLSCVLSLFCITPTCAQNVTRSWSAQLPPKSGPCTFSFDATRYAYAIGNIVVVRANAVTGEPIDTVAISKNSGIAYHGTTLFVLTGTVGDTVELAYIEADSANVVRTGIKLFTIGSRVLTSVRLVSLRNQPNLIMQGNITANGIGGASTGADGTWHFVNVNMFAIDSSRSGTLDAFSEAADGTSFASTETWFSHSTGRYIPSQMGSSWRVRGVPIATQAHYMASPFQESTLPVPTGIFGIVAHQNYMYDLRYRITYPPDTTIQALLCNVAPGGWMLAARGTPTNRILGVYDLISRIWNPFDTLEPCVATEIEAVANAQVSALFVRDIVGGTVNRYQLPNFVPHDEVLLHRSRDTIVLFDTAFCSLSIFSQMGAHQIRWYLDDYLIATTLTPSLVFSSSTAGVYSMRAEVVDTNGNVLRIAAASHPLVVRRPPAVQMYFRPGTSKIWTMSISPECNHLALGRQDTLSIYRLPETTIDEGAALVQQLAEDGAVAFGDSSHSLIWLRSELVGLPLAQTWYLGTLLSEDMTPILRIGHARWGNGSTGALSPMATIGKMIYNVATRRWLSLVLTFSDWTAATRDGGIVSLPTYAPEPTAAAFILQPSRDMSDADAGYSKSLIVSYGDRILILDLASGDTVAIIMVSQGMYARSAIATNAHTIVSTSATYKKSTGWNQTYVHPFTDGHRVLRLPNEDYVFILRSNSDSIGHVVSAITGEIVHTFHGGFGIPTCLVYDRVRKAIHVGDSWGFVSTWPLPTKYTTDHSENRDSDGSRDLRIAPIPTEDIFTIDSEVDVGISAINVFVYNVSGRLQDVDAIGNNTFSIANSPSGVYLVIVRTPTGIRSQMLVKR